MLFQLVYQMTVDISDPPWEKRSFDGSKEASFRTFNGEVNRKLVKRETKSKDTNSCSAFRVMPLKKPEKSPRFLKV